MHCYRETRPRAPWNTQPGWQIAASTPSRWIQFRLWLATKVAKAIGLRRR